MSNKPEYHVACGVFRDPKADCPRVYAGVRSRRTSITAPTWLHKTDVTAEFLVAVVEYVGIGNEVEIIGTSGRKLTVTVREVQP